MTKEDKDLLLKDLCARLPYGVICKRYENAYELVDIDIKRGLVYLLRHEQYVPYSIISGDEIKSFLRPMSSMTEEEMVEFKWLNDECDKMPTFDYISVEHYRLFDWLNRNHFDFRNLIERGLAIDCTGLNIY